MAANSTDATWTQANSEEPDGNSGKKKGLSLSFNKRIVLVMLAVSLITVLSSIAVLSFVWEQHFQTYTRENVQRVADSTADSIAQGYKAAHGDWYSGALNAASSASILYDSINVQVRDENGAIVYDDSTDKALGAAAMKESSGNVAKAAINIDGNQVGTVFVRVHGSDTLLTQTDAEFREKSYQAMIFAAFIAMAISIVVGVLFSRALVAPIRRITNTAKALKEGDYSARTGMKGTDEIARLGNMFDAMADSVEQNRKLERRLVTDVAHELRTPLMAIQSTVEAMIDGVFEPDAERLETLNSEVRRLSRLVDALLKLSRLESRTKPVYGDADLLRQATANLISNAVRYTPEGGTITITARKGELMGQISVRDTGIGLTPEEAKMVFQRFWRADSGRARATGGLGVGLSVVKEIVDQHNGWVRVEGRPNEGACFTVYVPLYTSESEKKKGTRPRFGTN